MSFLRSLFQRRPIHISVEAAILRDLWPGDVLLLSAPKYWNHGEARSFLEEVRDAHPEALKGISLVSIPAGQPFQIVRCSVAPAQQANGGADDA